jgi:hypothetical protein
MPKKDDIIEPIDADFEDVVKIISQPASPKQSKNKDLTKFQGLQPALGSQYTLDLEAEVQKEAYGIEMGVLGNGIPYLTQKGLATITGIARSVVYDITKEWAEKFEDNVLGNDRNSFLKEYLFKNGYTESQLYIEFKQDGTISYAYPDIVCMAILEFYAFESKSKNDTALTSYRKFATFGLQKFIYEALQYTPSDKWKYHNDRVSILKDSSPDGYFIIFNEITGLAVDLINANLTVNDKTIPDISVGLAWGKYWKDKNLEEQYGSRIEYDHYYPEYYPQSTSNPQRPKAYPDGALPEFRKWFRHEYLTTKFPPYILKKANILSGGKEEAEMIANMYKPKEIERE